MCNDAFRVETGNPNTGAAMLNPCRPMRKSNSICYRLVIQRKEDQTVARNFHRRLWTFVDIRSCRRRLQPLNYWSL